VQLFVVLPHCVNLSFELLDLRVLLGAEPLVLVFWCLGFELRDLVVKSGDFAVALLIFVDEPGAMRAGRGEFVAAWEDVAEFDAEGTFELCASQRLSSPVIGRCLL
jgi:hypothetical protein